MRKIVCAFPRQTDSQAFDALYHAGAIGPPAGYRTLLAGGQETRLINGRH